LSGLGNIAKKVADHASTAASGQHGVELLSAGRVGSSDFLTDANHETCQAIQPCSFGNFPYYWLNPTNLKFNEKTYHWISAGLKANSSPVQLAQPFINLYISALSKIYYSLSSDDENNLKQKKTKLSSQQMDLLSAWRAAFGNIPVSTGDKQPIDVIISKITQTWASPPTNLEELLSLVSPSEKLNRIPPSGIPLLPVLLSYLSALQSTVSLTNSTTMDGGYIHKALTAAQFPDETNGAVETSDGEMRPAYFVSTPLSEILESLNSNDLSKTLSYEMSAERCSSTECSVITNSGAADRVPIVDFLSIETDEGIDLFKDHILKGHMETKICLTFLGVTKVNFGPSAFLKAGFKHWYWIKPIHDAIANEGKDVSGFKFSPKPQIEFAKAGPFGFLTGVTISKRVSLTLTCRCKDYKAIAKAVEGAPTAYLKFLSMPISDAVSGSSRHEVNVSTIDKDSTVIINLIPSSDNLSDSMDSSAFVICAQLNYPAAAQSY
jgi:hypothetical protein